MVNPRVIWPPFQMISNMTKPPGPLSDPSWSGLARWGKPLDSAGAGHLVVSSAGSNSDSSRQVEPRRMRARAPSKLSSQPCLYLDLYLFLDLYLYHPHMYEWWLVGSSLEAIIVTWGIWIRLQSHYFWILIFTTFTKSWWCLCCAYLHMADFNRTWHRRYVWYSTSMLPTASHLIWGQAG